jgi:hypothetical protein
MGARTLVLALVEVHKMAIKSMMCFCHGTKTRIPILRVMKNFLHRWPHLPLGRPEVLRLHVWFYHQRLICHYHPYLQRIDHNHSIEMEPRVASTQNQVTGVDDQLVLAMYLPQVVTVAAGRLESVDQPDKGCSAANGGE